MFVPWIRTFIFWSSIQSANVNQLNSKGISKKDNSFILKKKNHRYISERMRLQSRRLRTIMFYVPFLKKMSSIHHCYPYNQLFLNTIQSYGENDQIQRYKQFFSVLSPKPLNWSEPKCSMSIDQWHCVLTTCGYVFSMQMDDNKIGSV